jgi:hypothetical protein
LDNDDGNKPNQLKFQKWTKEKSAKRWVSTVSIQNASEETPEQN